LIGGLFSIVFKPIWLLAFLPLIVTLPIQLRLIFAWEILYPPRFDQGCQIFRGTTCQNWNIHIRGQQNIPKLYKLYHIIITKTPAFSIPRPSKMCPNWNFWYVNIPSGNPRLDWDLNDETSKFYSKTCIIPPTIHHKKQNIFILYQMKVPLSRQR
jgi:hypothetical protein